MEVSIDSDLPNGCTLHVKITWPADTNSRDLVAIMAKVEELEQMIERVAVVPNETSEPCPADAHR